jgi:hypothetical protein
MFRYLLIQQNNCYRLNRITINSNDGRLNNRSANTKGYNEEDCNHCEKVVVFILYGLFFFSLQNVKMGS